jgi:hypothetical protein
LGVGCGGSHWVFFLLGVKRARDGALCDSIRLQAAKDSELQNGE